MLAISDELNTVLDPLDKSKAYLCLSAPLVDCLRSKPVYWVSLPSKDMAAQEGEGPYTSLSMIELDASGQSSLRQKAQLRCHELIKLVISNHISVRRQAVCQGISDFSPLWVPAALLTCLS